MKKIVFALAAAVMIPGAGVAAIMTQAEHQYTFYDTPEGEIVGYLTIYCDGSSTMTGTWTAHHFYEYWPCD